MSGPRARRGAWLAVVAVLLTAVPMAAAAPRTGHAASFSWEPVSRFGGDANGDGMLDHESDPALPRALAQHPVRIRPSAALCARGERLTWAVDGRRVADPRLRRDGGRRCSTILSLPAGRHEVSVGGHRQQVTVDDRLVVALGDSVAAGEGDPPFAERRCHRSHRAGLEVAARRVAAQQPRTAITFVSLACSGAEITEGLLHPYKGVEGHRTTPALAPQVDRLRTLRAHNGGRLDAVLVTVGANDVFFGAVVRHCIARSRCFKQTLNGGGSANEEVGLALEELIGRYDRLAAALRGIVRAPRDVVLSEYHDPTHGADGEYCAHTGIQISQEELEWAHDGLLVPLNQRVAAAARRNGWRPVGGIARDYATHGYCSPDRWVRTLPAQLRRKGVTPPISRALGTLHPSVHGQLAIANRVAPVLADVLRLAPPPAVAIPVAHDGLRGIPRQASSAWKYGLAWLVLGLLAVGGLQFGWGWRLLLALGGAVTFAVRFVPRLLLLARPRHRADQGEYPLEAAPPPPALNPAHALIGAAALLVLLAALVVPAGLGTLWIRFRLAQIPAEQALGAASMHELLATGAPALIVVTGAGALAVLAAWAIDSEGTSRRASRRLLGILLVAALITVVASQHHPGDGAVRLVAGFLAGAWLLHVAVDLAMELIVVENGAGRAGRRVIRALRLHDGGLLGVPRVAWRGLPLVLIAGDVIWAMSVSGGDRPLLAAPLVAAALCFVTGPGIARPATSPTDGLLDVPRLVLCAGALGVLLSLLYRDESWLFAATGIALLLASACLRVAHISRRRFAPYGISLFLAVGAFMAAEAVLAAARQPRVQSFSAITTGGRGVCGAYVGHSDGRLWFAHVRLDERGDHRTPVRRSGQLLSVPDAQVSASEIGSLQGIPRALNRAASVRDALARDNGVMLTPADRGELCRHPPPAPAVPVPGEARDLALRYQPDLVLDAKDGFWPIPVSTIFAMEDRRAHACRVIPDAKPAECLRLDRPSDLPWQGGEGQTIEYPAATRTKDQHAEMIDALGTANPERTATVYYLVTHREGRRSPWAIQYWFYYAYDYLRTAKGNAVDVGKHEGDWEHIGVLLSADKQPRYLWTARHTAREEGRVYRWRDSRVQWRGEHPLIYLARGSHASYVRCGDQPRYQLPMGVIDDEISCDARHQLHLPGATTALRDLSRAPWACWAGEFGHAPKGVLERIPYNVVPGPRSPLWQQQFDSVRAEPCRGLPTPAGSRDAPGEEVLRGDVVHALRTNAGHLGAVADHCSDWEKPPGDGAYLVVCSSEMMLRQRESGFTARGPGVRIDTDDATYGSVPAADAVPPVAGDERLSALDRWVIRTSAPVRGLDVYAACRRGGGVLRTRFSGVSLDPGESLVVDTHAKDRWVLRDAEDRPVQPPKKPGVASGAVGHGTSCRG